ncbi:MAG TPA: inositol monophosphatase family protein [Phycisphaerales bacterium]|nr:inositol monophosphatase family protein [Phycisphaerales bacterium]
MRTTELGAALGAVEDACRVCRHVQRRLDVLRSMTKDDASPVTIGDFASQALVARGLSRAGAMLGGMVAEESAAFLKHPDHAAHLKACVEALRESGAWPDATADEVVGMVDLGAADPEVLVSERGGWTLDPIDGTKGFLRGEQYCVCLAKIRGGGVEIGVLGCPNLPTGPLEKGDAPGNGSCYWAVRGEGAHMRPLATNAVADVRIEHGRVDGPARLAESVEMSHTRRDLTEEIMRRAGPVGNHVQIDSQCKYALLARGDADVYLRLPSKKGYVQRVWDHAPGVLIAQEAGCIVTDVLGRELDFSRGRGLEANVGILGAPPELHGRLVEAAKEVLDSVA